MKLLRIVLTITVTCAALSFSACAKTKEHPMPDAATMFRDAVATHEKSSAINVAASDRTTLLEQAAVQYAAILKHHADDARWAAPAMRSLGNVRVAQGRMDDALSCYAAVGSVYPDESWEVLQSWKTAADLLWDAGRKEEATAFYRQIVDRCNGAESSDIEARIVKAAARRTST